MNRTKLLRSRGVDQESMEDKSQRLEQSMARLHRANEIRMERAAANKEKKRIEKLKDEQERLSAKS